MLSNRLSNSFRSKWASASKNLFLLLPFIGLFYLRHVFNKDLSLSPDIAWLTIAAERMLHGGNYVQHFFESNPPFILYLLAPIVFLKNVFFFSYVNAIYAYLYALNIVALVLSAVFLKRQHISFHLNVYILGILAFLFFIFPVEQIGQREPIMLALIFPYLILCAQRAQPKINLLPTPNYSHCFLFFYRTRCWHRFCN